MNGSKLSAKVTGHLRLKYNAYVVNVMVSGRSGVPDLLACIDGKFFGFEIKGDGDRLSMMQSINLEQIEESGGSAYVIRCVEDVDLALGRGDKSALKPFPNIKPRKGSKRSVAL